MALATVTLNDKYTADDGRVYLTGVQALARMLFDQRRRDRALGLNTAGFVSGYRGSPLGALDRELWRAGRFLEDHDIRFQPGVNEELAATAVWGSQQVGLFPGARHDGVFALWYGKGPGVDRSGDAFWHGNLAGSARHGGVLLVMGDDPACRSSTVPSQSDFAMVDVRIPTLNPANVQEILEYGLFGWALSRYSGCWVSMKALAETMDSAASVPLGPGQGGFATPADFDMPDGGLNIRWPDPATDQEARLDLYKLDAARAFVRANGLDRVVVESPTPRFGIVTAGKASLDTMQALSDLGLDAETAARAGLTVYKPGVSWPLEPDGLRTFATGLEEIMVIEEQRPVMEGQIKEQLYNIAADSRPRVVGKRDERGQPLLPSVGELNPTIAARAIASRLAPFHHGEPIQRHLAFLDSVEAAARGPGVSQQRLPTFCSGCPHNTSTVVPEGSRALAGIGCHTMVLWMDRDTAAHTQMGAEGANWVGQAPFTDTPHVFVNIGDGTYFHSGLLAIRQAVAAKVNVTYKILYNDAVAMTGGQPMDGPLTVPMIARQVAAEGVSRVAVVSEDPNAYPVGAFDQGVSIHHRDDLDAVQRRLRDVPEVSVLVFDQTCAAEKRRRRKRGLYPDPPRRLFINEEVCEGCGDCGRKSNCVSLVPVETEFGRKRAIDQASCNKDYSCLKGFCPSFVTVHGGRPRRGAGGLDDGAPFPVLPEPNLPGLSEPYGILVTGIGGTGVVTIGALLGMAAHVEGHGVTVMDQTGLAQKNGAVFSHIRIAKDPKDLHAVRLADGGARLLLGCDGITAAGDEALGKLRPGVTRVILNGQRTMHADFARDPDLAYPEEAIRQALDATIGAEAVDRVDAGSLARAILGDPIAANVLMLGYAWQKGLIPLTEAALMQAVEINGVAVPFNQRAFLWGRRAAHDPAAVERLVQAARPEPARPLAKTLDETIALRVEDLTAYQNAAHARRYTDLVARVREAEARRASGHDGLAEAVARSYYKLLAYKDEYEVARLYSDGRFRKRLKAQFEGDYRLTLHLAPPLVARIDPNSGEPEKRTYGPWILPFLGGLARLKGLRGTPFDIFGHSPDRRLERRLIADYEATIAEVIAHLEDRNHARAVEIAAVPETIRGFGPVKERAAKAAASRQASLLEALRAAEPTVSAAE